MADEDIPFDRTQNGPTPEWVVAVRYGSPEDYDIPTAPCIGEDCGDVDMDLLVDGESVIRAEKPWPILL